MYKDTLSIAWLIHNAYKTSALLLNSQNSGTTLHIIPSFQIKTSVLERFIISSFHLYAPKIVELSYLSRQKIAIP